MKNISTQQCDHVALLTNHCRKLEGFYMSKLGFQKEKEEILPKSHARLIFGLPSDCLFIRLVAGNLKIEIFQPVSARLERGRRRIAGLHHWGFCVADRKKFAEELKKKKVKLIEVKRNAHIVYFIKDPDGNLVEIRD